jgi:hypothetical protein
MPAAAWPRLSQAFVPAVNGGMLPLDFCNKELLKINGLICKYLEFRTLGSPSAIPV